MVLSVEQRLLLAAFYSKEAYDKIKLFDLFSPVQQPYFESIGEVYKTTEVMHIDLLAAQLEQRNVKIDGFKQIARSEGATDFHSVDGFIKQQLQIVARAQINDYVRQLNNDDISVTAAKAKIGKVNTEVEKVKSIQIGQQFRRNIERDQNAIDNTIDLIDFFTNGDILERGWYVILGARPGIGKTTYMVQLAIDAVNKGYKPALASIECGPAMTSDKVACNLAGVSFRKWRKRRREPGIITKKEEFNVAGAYDRFFSKPIWLFDDSKVFIEDIYDEMYRLHTKEGGIDVLFLDYLQFLKAREKFGSIRERIDYISSTIKSMLLEFNILGFILGQMLRNGAQDQLKESDGPLQDCDLFINMDREMRVGHAEKKSVMCNKITKFRWGEDNVEYFIRRDDTTGRIEEINYKRGGDE